MVTSSGMSNGPDLEALALEFAADVGSTVGLCLPGDPTIAFEKSPTSPRATFNLDLVLTVPANGGKGMTKPGAHLHLSFDLGLDRSGQHLAVWKSAYKLLQHRTKSAILRVEYERNSRGVPCSHVQIHAHSGPLTDLLSKARHSAPHALESLHIPTGGDRFRPCVEDFIQFLIEECRIVARPGWLEHVEDGRERWRRMQTAAVVRDRPEVAIETLRQMGYFVEGAVLSGDHPSARTRW